MRVFPNMYPASDLHEVVVYSPGHHDSLASVSVDHLAELLQVIRGRIRVMAQSSNCRYVLPFCNHGPQAGATREHPHLQIISTPRVPAVIVDKLDRFADHHTQSGRCLLCDKIGEEEKSGVRLVVQNDAAVAFAPEAGRLPYELLVASRSHRTSIVDASDDELSGFAGCLNETLKRLTAVFSSLSYNVVIHNAPPNGMEQFHWHVEILPRLSMMAGFEAGTGFFINSVLPENAAEKLRATGG